jgi:molybdopterin synthase sulfur carrier subunit
MTQVNVLYFAALRERFGRAGEALSLPLEAPTVRDLVTVLRARGAPFDDALAPGRAFRVAVNQDVATPDQTLAEGDEVALFPPVTGG